MRVKFASKLGLAISAMAILAGSSGCPKPPPNVSIALLVSPVELAFGADKSALDIFISKTYSSRAMPPFRVTANQEWLSFTPSTGVSSGPSDKIRVVASVDRSKMEAGQNLARITVSAEGMVPVEIIATATQLLVADFSVSNVFPFVGQQVQFFDESAFSAGTGPIISHMWDFGDGTTSTAANPFKTYAEPGTYSVTLTTQTAFATSTVTKEDFIVVSEPLPPVANFTATPTSAFVGQQIQFTNTSMAGSLPITSFLWDFGDNTTSTAQNPTKIYATTGVFTVSLTVTSGLGSDTETKTNFITVTQSQSPIPNFTANRTNILQGDNVTFTDQTIPGSVPVTSRLWNFGDGGTSTQVNPTHVYNQPGVYTVSLTVNTALHTETETKVDFITVRSLTALDRYVRKPDPTTSFTVQTSGPNVGVFTHFIDLVSQTWRSANEVYRIYDQNTRQWRHKLTVIQPSAGRKQLNPTALLIVAGGSNVNPSFPGQQELLNLTGLAIQTNSVVAQLNQVPNQPIFFTDMQTTGLTEDGAIAYTFDKFLDDTSNEEWPLLLPMVKSVVKAMDVIQEVLAGRGVPVGSFVVTGASKRGWTTWLTAASDPQQRVRGLAPIVIDVLNMEPSLRHHFQSYGFYAPAIADYDASPAGFDVLQRFGTPQSRLLLDIVDPFEYRERLLQPKFIINATGDEFFVPDSAQFYFNALLGTKRLFYAPNQGHGISQPSITEPLLAFFAATSTQTAMPTVEFSYPVPERVVVTTNTVPSQVLLWQALDPNPARRDFRQTGNTATTPVWSSTPLFDQGGNTFVGEVAVPGPNAGWRGYFVQLRFPSPFGVDYIFTTETRIVPETLPFSPPF